MPQSLQTTVDVVLKSSDEVEFPVHKLFLSVASSFFKDMFEAAHADSHTGQDKLPVVPMAETAAAIVALMSSIYPVERASFDKNNLNVLRESLEAARKYDISSAMSTLRKDLMLPTLIQACPVEVYGIACRMGFIDEAKVAARRTLYMDLSSVTTVARSCADSDMHTTDLARLISMRTRIENQVESLLHWSLNREELVDTGAWAKPEYAKERNFPQCGKSGRISSWVRAWAEHVAAEIRTCPMTDDIFRSGLEEAVFQGPGLGCDCCPPGRIRQLADVLSDIKSRMNSMREEQKFDDLFYDVRSS